MTAGLSGVARGGAVAWLGVLLGLVAVLGVVGWASRAVHGVLLAVPAQVLLMWWALFHLWATPLPLRGGWFRVRPWEPRAYRRAGVYVFMGVLRAVGWERLRREAQGFDGTRASLRRYERRAREAEYSHALLGGITLALVVAAVLVGQVDSAVWLLVTGVLCHGYPVMLQRTLRARLLRLGVR